MVSKKVYNKIFHNDKFKELLISKIDKVTNYGFDLIIISDSEDDDDIWYSYHFKKLEQSEHYNLLSNKSIVDIHIYGRSKDLIIEDNNIYLDLNGMKEIFILKQLIKRITGKNNIQVNKVIPIFKETEIWNEHHYVKDNNSNTISQLKDKSLRHSIYISVSSLDLIFYKLDITSIIFHKWI
jgi:DNA-directed RNA polymerase beta subunit